MAPTNPTETPENQAVTPSKSAEARGLDRNVIGIAGVVLLATCGLVGYGILSTPQDPEPAAVPSVAVTYEVTGTGTAEIAYRSDAESAAAAVERNVRLPWKKTVQVPLTESPTVNITLDKTGGQASCTLAVQGKHVQLATASGAYGRATCTGPARPSN
ncbi:MmpS family transport accessory protein [Streptomyces sp. NPDC101118]|uniref:MmpS family transport accessory protein n=1 Tax=Streptomyces sp. NPDC101118 TaxID=3366109 RepID=UPI00380E32F3